MTDPRDKVNISSEEVLTEDSDDPLADLEKEFEIKKQKLLEERARKPEKKTKRVQVERSPSPPRRSEGSKQNLKELHGQTPNQSPINYQTKIQTTSTAKEIFVPQKPRNTIQRASRPFQSTQFATRLYNSKTESETQVNYNERVFEFENIPSMTVEKTTEKTCRDTISGEILSRRYYKENVIEKIVAEVKILRLPKLLAKVVPPKFEEPSYVNWCLTGIVMHKSEPKTSVNNKKYMALRVGNFHHTVDVMLFGDAFQKYWKVRVGDVIVILNPAVKKFGNSFSLSILDDLNNLLELGTLKHYGHCAAKTTQGEPCKHVVDKLKNMLCSYHEESKYKQGSRMELQGSVKPKAPQNRKGETSEMFVSNATKQPMFVQYANAGFHEKDVVFAGGQQFDQAKYDRPVESKASRLRKQRANAKLEEQLLQNVAPRHLNDLAKLGILNHKRNLADKQESARKIRKHAFNSTFITGMGFDPTVTNNGSGGERKTNLEQLKELRQLSQAKKISLEPSKEDMSKKQDKWRQAMKITKITKTSVQHEFMPTKLTSNLRTMPVISLLDEDDSDIEITFTKDVDRLHYEDAKNGSTNTEKRGRRLPKSTSP